MIPRLATPDSTLRFLRDGYLFGIRGFREVGDDAFRTRLLGRPVIVARGTEAARFFSEGGRFRRAGAIPPSVVHLLQDTGSVQTLDGDAHAMRKQLFLELTTQEGARAKLTEAFRDAWLADAETASGRGPVRLVDFAALALTRAALAWTGIRGDLARPHELCPQLLSMVENAGRFGPANWLARVRRTGTETWARSVIRWARSTSDVPQASIVARLAAHEEHGERLPVDVAAVELLNLLRPVVAVTHFVAFAALALHERPDWRRRFAPTGEAGVEPGTGGVDFRPGGTSTAGDTETRALMHDFAQEVRRFFPFFPLVGGRATSLFPWRGELIAPGDWMLLDLYGTDHDPELWPHPDVFDAHRFQKARDAGADAEDLIVAQGGGAYTDHRCPGEPATVDLLVEAIALLSRGPDYAVPPQDLRISLRRFPAEPEDGMLVAFA